MAEFKTLECKWCNKPFTQENYKQIYCSVQCRHEYNHRHKLPKPKKKDGMSELKRLTIEAKAHGMTYGQYVARMGL